MILAADVGGTKAHLALFAPADLGKLRETVLTTDAVASLPEALRDFVGPDLDRLEACGLGVAGSVIGECVRAPANLPWDVEAAAIGSRLGGVPVRLENDLNASARGLARLGPDDLVTLQAGVARDGNRALVSPGTGLGEAVLWWDGRTHHPLAAEGGHADFAPRTDEEVELLRSLREIHGRVSCERVVSGPGLVNVFAWLRDTGRAPEDAGLDLESPGAAAAITREALDGSSVICREALRVWTAAFGAEAGNVALRALALGGVYLGGGIPARVVDVLRGEDFLEAFRAKEPHRDLLAEIPVYVVQNAETTLLGAAMAAAEIVGAATRPAPRAP